MKNTGTNIFVICCSVLISSSVVAANDVGESIATKGNNKGAIACLACHGQKGEGNVNAGYPYLAGLPNEYLVNQLRAFADGSRNNPIMKPFASSLTRDEMNAVAGYYSSLDNPILSGADSKISSSPSLGARLATNGKWEAGVPACFKCHGEDGKGIVPYFPPITGQSAEYIKNQLIAWQAGKRKNDPLALMQSVAKSLDQQEIEAVARYLAEQPKQ